jgi:hypothetical protein
MMKKLSVLSVIISMILFACQGQKKQEVVQEKKSIPSVCIWDGGTVRTAPSKDAKWMSSLSLGEEVIWLGITAVDSSDRNLEYYKIQLSDSTLGWASKWVIITDAKPSVIIKSADIYRRPDILTGIDKEFEPMEIVAVEQTENEWIKVVGAEQKKKGWIRKEFVSQENIDIAVGVLAMRALEQQKPELKTEKIEAIVNNPAFQSSVFIPELKEMLRSSTE